MNSVMNQYFREMQAFRAKTYEVIKAFDAWQTPAADIENMDELYETFRQRMEDLREMIK